MNKSELKETTTPTNKIVATPENLEKKKTILHDVLMSQLDSIYTNKVSRYYVESQCKLVRFSIKTYLDYFVDEHDGNFEFLKDNIAKKFYDLVINEGRISLDAFNNLKMDVAKLVGHLNRLIEEKYGQKIGSPEGEPKEDLVH